MAQVLGFERGDDGELRLVADPSFAGEMTQRGAAGSAIDWVALSLTGSYTVHAEADAAFELPIVCEDQQESLPFADAARRYGRPDLDDQPNT